MKNNIQTTCPKCGGKAILYQDGRRNKIRCFECGYTDYLLGLKLKREPKVINTLSTDLTGFKI